MFQFNRESKKAKSGSRAEEGKVKWRFYNALQFLKDKTIGRLERLKKREVAVKVRFKKNYF